MATETPNLRPSAKALRTDIEGSYLYTKTNLVLFKASNRTGIGNETVFYNRFVTGFENLFLATFFDTSLKSEKFDNKLLIDQVKSWLYNGKKKRKLGERLFTAYYAALFSHNILSIRGGNG